MTALTLSDSGRSLRQLVPGLTCSAVITGVALYAGALPAFSRAGLSALTLAILSGMIIGNTLWPRLSPRCEPGVLFAKQHLLRLGIILYGFRLTFGQIAGVGASGLLIDILTLSTTFMLACWLGQKIFRLDRQTSWLIGAGSSICGAAAILATEPVVKAEASKVTVAIATVVIFGTLSMVIYPLLWPWLAAWFSPQTYGVFIGSTVHEVAQVAAAGEAVSPDAGNAAVIAKMLRVMMLAPFLLLIAARVKQLAPAGEAAGGTITVPWFALLFVLVAIINSFHLLPAVAVDALVTLDTVLLTMAMAALGLTTHISALKQAGIRPLLLALVLLVWLIIGGGAINLAVTYLLA